ncbi:MAG: hypothetical protein BWY07_02007 [Candidatus Hydrogenedentes bacterium ADurb.Bin170]|nr:MAG: hypothetical protein BWY07_02007 [Candidatus Hydrogenedentes bacterium ADurb.Bin170]
MNLSFSDIAPFLGAAGNELRNADQNNTGADDFIGELLIYIADAHASIEQEEPLPDLPEILLQGTTERISGGIVITLRVASSVLAIAQFKASGKLRLILRYAAESIRRVLAGQTVPGLAPAIAKQLMAGKA